MTKVESGMIESIDYYLNYFGEDKTLGVVLKSAPEFVYLYKNVPTETYIKFFNAPSKGKFFVKEIKGKFDFIKKER